MAGKAASSDRKEVLAARLYGQAGRRWLMLAAALIVLLVLGAIAGHVRNPEAVKREWAVVVSRVLAGAAGLLLIRLLLFSDEERVPVLFFDMPSGTSGDAGLGRIGSAIARLKDRGYVTVPLNDIVEFVREQRYVPKKCFGLVVEASGSEDIAGIFGALRGSHLTILLPPTALHAGTGQDRPSPVPSGVSIGLNLTGEQSPRDAEGLRASLKACRDTITVLNRGEAGFVKVGYVQGVDLRGLLKQTGYACFLNGRGFNRFGDEPHLLRLLDVTPVVRAGKGWKGLSMCMDLFKGKHYVWPAVAVTGLIDRESKGR